MRKWALRLLKVAYVGLITSLPVAAIANYTATQGAGTNFGSIVIAGVHFMSQLLCDATTANQCAAVSAAGAVKVDNSAVTQPISAASNIPVSQATAANLNATVVGTGTFAAQLTGATNNVNLVNWGGSALGAMANYGTSPGAVLVPGVNAFITNAPTVAQATAANLNATVVGTGTFAVQAALNAETTKNIGTIRMTGNIGGVLDAIGQNVAAPANWLQAGCQFQTTPTTITAANGSPCQMDNAGNILVNVKTATGLAQGSTTSGQTGSMIMGAVTTAAPTYTTAQTTYASLTTGGALRHDVASVNSVAILTGTGAVGTGAQRVAIGTDTATIAGSAPGTAGTASANVVTVQGIASMTKLLVTPDSVALPANQSVNVAQVNGVTTQTGTGASGTGTQRVAVATDSQINLAANVTATACSGTITTGGTAQNAFTAQTTLHGFTIANIDTTEPLWISFTTTAAASGTDSYPLPAATATTFAGFGSFTAPPGFGLNHALSVIAATTSHKFSCTWW